MNQNQRSTGCSSEYENWLERAYQRISKKESRERFEVPKVNSWIQGNKTILTNLKQISSYLNRDVNHLLKYLLKELATAGEFDGNKVTFVGKFNESILNQKIEKYVEEFVRCKECKSPDTKLLKEDRMQFLQCLACGAKYPVRRIK